MGVAGSKVHSSEQEIESNRSLEPSSVQSTLPDDALVPVEHNAQSSGRKRSRPVDLHSKSQQQTRKRCRADEKDASRDYRSATDSDHPACIASKPANASDKLLCLRVPYLQRSLQMGLKEDDVVDRSLKEKHSINGKHPGSTEKAVLPNAAEVLALEQRFAKLRAASLKTNLAEAPLADHMLDAIDLIDEQHKNDEFPICDGEDEHLSIANNSSTQPAPGGPRPNTHDSAIISSGLLRTISRIRTAPEEVPAGLFLAPEVGLSRASKQQIEKLLRQASQELRNAHLAEDFSQERLSAPPKLSIVPGKTHRWLREGAPPWRVKKMGLGKESVGSGLDSAQTMSKKRTSEDSDHVLESRQRKRLRIDAAMMEQYEEGHQSKRSPGQQRKLHSLWQKGDGMGFAMKQ